VTQHMDVTPASPDTDDRAPDAAVDGETTETTTPAKSPARRRRRGGRGRSRSRSGTGSAGTAAEAAASEDEAAGDGGEPAMDASSIDAAGDAGDGGEPSSAASASSTARRRRRRGGRGRSRGRATADGDATTSAVAEDIELVEPPEPEPRRETAEPESIPEPVSIDGAEAGDAQASGATATNRRRRRGGRGRGGRGGARAVTAEAQPEPGEAEPTGTSEDEAQPATPARGRSTRGRTSTRTRTARTRSPRSAAADAEPANGAIATPAGPTRLRRTRGTSAGARRRREPMPIVPRVTDKLMAITEHGERDQIAILEERALVQHYVTRAGARSMVGNVYLGRVQNVLPGMEAAFVDVGRGRNAVLYAGEVNYSPEDLEGKQPPRIEQVLKSGQSVLVQVTKDPIGGKGARLTAKVSMPGRYLVLQPNWEITGISKRLPDAERRRLRALLKKIRPEGHGLIVRTAAEEASEDDLRADVERLVAEWNAIEKKAKRAKAPAVLYEEPELTVRVVRDLFTDEEYRELVTDSERVYTLVTEYLGKVAPDLLPKVHLHTGKLPVFEEFHIVEQIHKGLDRKVWLPSGGYLVIDRTEALTVIDVNTGKSVGKTNLEETVVNTNIEAAREVARQLRLRDIGGMIIIDFIDMLLDQNKRRVVDTLKEEMARDKTRSQVFDISPLGLLEVTRKRVSGGLLESFSETCPTCEGRGVILTYEA